MDNMRQIVVCFIIALMCLSPASAQIADNPIITPKNLHQVRELWRIGRGRLVDAQVSPTGDQIAVTATIGVWLYDTSDLTAEPRLLSGHGEAVTHSVYSPDGTHILSYGGDGSIMSVVLVWDALTGDLLFTLDNTLHPQGVQEAGFSDDGTTIFTQSTRDVVYLWDAQTGRYLGEADEKPPTRAPLTAHPNGNFRLLPDKNVVSVIDATDTRIASLEGYTPQFMGAQFIPNSGWMVAIAQNDPTIYIINTITGAMDAIINTPHPIFTLDVSADGRYIVSGGFNRQVVIWQVGSWEQVHAMSGHEDIILRVRFSPSGRFIVSASEDKTARVWDATTGDHLHTLSHESPVVDVAYTPDERQIITAQMTMTSHFVQIWDATDLTRAPMVHQWQVYGFAPHPTLPLLVTRNAQNLQYFWLTPPADGVVDYGSQVTYDLLGSYTDVNFSPNGLIVAGASWHKRLVLQTLIPQAPIRLNGHVDMVRSAHFSPDGRFIVTSSSDGTLRIWGVNGG
jgi:WD40 repeat protein